MTMQDAEISPGEIDEVLKALANPVRREILHLMRAPEQNFPGQEHPYAFGVCASKIDARFGLSQSTVSAHLAVLQHAGLITAKRVGQWIFYRRNEPAVAAFLARIGTSL
jgi:DNA-binding transcriptional ArsR family regulator